MREIFAPKPPAEDLGTLFYTITPEDVGKHSIDTEVGLIRVSDVIGRVLPGDVGKRLFRHRIPGGLFMWQAESDAQVQARRSRA
jgi:hypothetical protein